MLVTHDCLQFKNIQNDSVWRTTTLWWVFVFLLFFVVVSVWLLSWFHVFVLIWPYFLFVPLLSFAVKWNVETKVIADALDCHRSPMVVDVGLNDMLLHHECPVDVNGYLSLPTHSHICRAFPMKSHSIHTNHTTTSSISPDALHANGSSFV